MSDQPEVSIQFKNSITKQKALKEYVESLKQINSYLSAIDTGKAKVVEDVAKSTNKMANKSTTDSVKTLGNNLTTAFNVTKLIAFRRAFERTMKEVSTYTKKSADFLENWNLLDVAFQNNTTEAEKFVNTLSEMYGLDESWGYRTVGLFKQLANAMGLTDEVGTKLSKTLTQLAIDTSSLYNIDVEDTVSILQSGLAGQTKPVRRLGGDITQTTLQLTLDAYGIDETINQLTYAEKRLAAMKDKYPNACLYGVDKNDGIKGTSMLYIFHDKPSVFGFPDEPQVPSTIPVWKDVVQPAGKVLMAAAGVAVAAGFVANSVIGVGSKKGDKDHE